MSLGAAALIALPILAVLWSVLGPASDTWAHLVRTSLAQYVANTALLVTLVAAGVISIGVVSAWLVTAYRFPGQRVLEWALVLPLAMPAYVMAYAYTDWLQFTGPVQGALRASFGWQAREYWFPEIRSLGGADVLSGGAGSDTFVFFKKVVFDATGALGVDRAGNNPAIGEQNALRECMALRSAAFGGCQCVVVMRGDAAALDVPPAVLQRLNQ